MSSPIDQATAQAGLTLTQQSQIVTLTISHPARRNAMTRQMWRDLQRVPLQLDDDVRCLIIRGQGEHFSAGGDISEYPEFRFDEKSLAQFHEGDVAPALEGLLALDIPVVAQISGHCIGGGLEIACCADIRIAGQSASFGAPIAKLGMPMAPREMAIVVKSAGEATVRELLLEARILNAEEMQSRGWLQRVVADAQVAAEAEQTAQRIAQLSPQAARLNKQTMRQMQHPFFKKNQPLPGNNCAPSAINSIVSNNSPYAYAPSREHREGIESFLEKRPAKF